MPSLVDSSIFMQAILCLPSLRKGFHNERMSNHKVLTYQELPSSVESSTFTQIHQCQLLHWKTTNEKKQKEVITYILQKTGIISSFLSFIGTVWTPSLRKENKEAANRMR